MIHRCCVNRLLHDCVYQDGVWKRVFFQEERDQLKPVLQNERLLNLYSIVNPEPVGSSAMKEEVANEVAEKEEEKTPSNDNIPSEASEEMQYTEEMKAALFKDCTLLYKITEKQGWYKTSSNECYFIRFKDATKTSFDILFPKVSSSELDSLIRQVCLEFGDSSFCSCHSERISLFVDIEKHSPNSNAWNTTRNIGILY